MSAENLETLNSEMNKPMLAFDMKMAQTHTDFYLEGLKHASVERRSDEITEPSKPTIQAIKEQRLFNTVSNSFVSYKMAAFYYGEYSGYCQPFQDLGSK